MMLALWSGAGDAATPAWHDSYDAAYRTAAAQDRPILLCFSPAAQPEHCPELRGVTAERKFVRVFVSKQSALGQRVYNLFQVSGDHACVVVERGRQYQYCRYERQLSAEEWRTVVATTAQANGKPEIDPLEPAVVNVPPETGTASAYVPAAAIVAESANPRPAAPLIEAVPAATPLPPTYPHWQMPRYAAPAVDCPACRRAAGGW